MIIDTESPEDRALVALAKFGDECLSVTGDGLDKLWTVALAMRYGLLDRNWRRVNHIKTAGGAMKQLTQQEYDSLVALARFGHACAVWPNSTYLADLGIRLGLLTTDYSQRLYLTDLAKLPEVI